MKVFNEERVEYYLAKKREIQRKREASKIVKDDALFIHYYGMSAYLELFPEARDFGVNWHNDVIQELENIRARNLGQELNGFYMAAAAVQDKKAGRTFMKTIKELLSQ